MSETDGKPTRTWEEIAEEASHEHDPKRLVELAEEIDRALEDRDKRLKATAAAAVATIAKSLKKSHRAG